MVKIVNQMLKQLEKNYIFKVNNKSNIPVKYKKLPDSIRLVLNFSSNNTKATITDHNGKVLLWYTTGSCNFANSKKKTPYAATMVMKKTCTAIINGGVKDISIIANGVGIGRDAALKQVFDTIGDSIDTKITSIKEHIKLPHNGTRPKKARK